MKIQKTELAQKINKLKNVVPKKTNNSVLQGILVHDGYLTASNMELTVKTRIDNVKSELFLIPAKAFDLISNLPDGEVEIISDENNTITIKADKIKNTYKTLDPESFPINELNSDSDKEITIESELLLASMKRVSYAISSQPNNSPMTALCLQAKDGFLNFVGLDGHVLAWDKIVYDGEFELLIPKNTVEKLLSVGITGDVVLKCNKNSAAFITKEYEIYTRIMDGKYYNYPAMFNELSLHTTVSRREFLDAMIRAKMCAEEMCPVRFELSGSDMNISITDKISDYHETVNLKEKLKEELIIGFDARLVLETLKAFDCKNVFISFGSSKMPMIVKAEDSNFKTIVLPVAIN